MRISGRRGSIGRGCASSGRGSVTRRLGSNCSGWRCVGSACTRSGRGDRAYRWGPGGVEGLLVKPLARSGAAANSQAGRNAARLTKCCSPPSTSVERQASAFRAGAYSGAGCSRLSVCRNDEVHRNTRLIAQDQRHGAGPTVESVRHKLLASRAQRVGGLQALGRSSEGRASKVNLPDGEQAGASAATK